MRRCVTKKLKEGRISGDVNTPQMRVDADLAKRRSLGNLVETTSATEGWSG